VLSYNHTPVMLDEAIQALSVQAGGRYIDCTLGSGGHAIAIMDNSSPGGQLLGIDADLEAIKVARKRMAAYSNSILLINDNFVNLMSNCLRHDFLPVNGILFDLGLSSPQLSIGRGFSFQSDAPLDMRFNTEQEVTAADLVNTLSEAKLTQLIRNLGEEIFSQRIARRIVETRPIQTTFELVRVIDQAVGHRRRRLHPATRTFLALRIAVNHELENLKAALEQAIDLLGFEGRLVVLSYHSLEDRIVKQIMRRESQNCICPPGTTRCVCHHKARLRIVNKKITTPSPDEVRQNPRSRSAKLRAAERIIGQEEYSQITDEERNCVEINGRGWRRPSMLRRLRTTFSASQC
jgi:16S rRNA (cytosine1402-N4)-methyltransferase